MIISNFKKAFLTLSLASISLGVSAGWSPDTIAYGAELRCSIDGEPLEVVRHYDVPYKAKAGDYRSKPALLPEFNAIVVRNQYDDRLFDVSIHYNDDLSPSVLVLSGIKSKYDKGYAEGKNSVGLTRDGKRISCSVEAFRGMVPLETVKESGALKPLEYTL